LLGHDRCADHIISFTKNSDESFEIDWKGRIALAYAGEEDYAYSFEAHISNVKFEGLVPRAEVAPFVFSPKA
jgi:hypothetical protein